MDTEQCMRFECGPSVYFNSTGVFHYYPLTKWLVIGKIKEGDYPLWGWYYFRWWLWKTVKRLMPLNLL